MQAKTQEGIMWSKKIAAVNFTAHLPNFDMKKIFTHLDKKLRLGNLNK